MKICAAILFAILVLSFQNAYAQNSGTSAFEKYQNISESLLKSEISLYDKKTIRLNDYKDEVIVLTFIAYWGDPVRRSIPALNSIYSENLSNVRIIGINVDGEEADDKESAEFIKFTEKMNVKFQTGWANKDFINEFIKISKLHCVPQTFIVKNGKLRGVFAGFGNKISEKLVETVKDISRE